MNFRILCGDVIARLRELPDESVHCVITSPPYWGLRDYGHEDQIGLEATPAEFTAKMVEVFEEVRRVLRSDGTCWINMGDSYAGSGCRWKAEGDENAPGRLAGKSIEDAKAFSKSKRLERGSGRWGGGNNPAVGSLKPKDLIGIPWRLAFALQDAGWWLRQDIIWSKSNPMPESVDDRCTKAHEYIFLMTKSSHYFYDSEAIREMAAQPDRQRNDRIGGATGHTVRHSEGGMIGASATRNKRSVWTISTEPFPEAHFATFPTELVKPCLLAGTSEEGCCDQCGAPLVRVTKQVETDKNQRMAQGWATNSGAHGTIIADADRQKTATAKVRASVTLEWKPSCSCRGGYRPVRYSIHSPGPVRRLLWHYASSATPSASSSTKLMRR